MRNIYLLLLVIVLPINLFSQDWKASTILQSTSTIEVEGSVLDNDKNIYVYGTFEGTIENISPTLSSRASKDIFIAKYTPQLDLTWIKRIGGPSYTYKPDVDILNDTLLVTGTFVDSVYFSDTQFQESVGFLDVFVAKYDTSGQYINSELLFFGSDYHYSGELKILNQNEYMITGQFWNDSVNINNDTILVGRSNVNDPFYSKHKFSNHDVIWAKYNELNNGAKYSNIAQHNDSIYVNGYFVDSLTFDKGTIRSKNSSHDLFLYALGQQGNGQWLRRTYSSGDDATATMDYDRYGNLYFGGFYRSNDFVADSTENLISQDTSRLRRYWDLFLMKYNKTGNLQWKRDYGSMGKEWTRTIEENNGIVYIGGYYSDSLVFGSDTLLTDSVNDYGVLMGTFDNEGNMLEGIGVNGPGGDDVANTMSVDEFNNVYLAGYFNSQSITFGSTQHTNPNPGTKVAFIARYQPPFNTTFTEKENVTCYNGTDGKLTVTPYFGVPPYNYEWTHDGNSLALSDSSSSSLESGQYTVTVTDSRDSTDVITTSLSQPDSIVFNGIIQVDGVETDSLDCYDGSNGDIFIDPYGSNGGFSYAWTTSNGSGVELTAEDQTGLTRGDYNLEITDQEGCTADTNFVIKAPAPITFDGTVVENIGNFQNGSVDLAVSGGTGDPAGFTYNWDGPDPNLPADTTQDLMDLTYAGNYTVSVTDDNACAADTTVTIADSSGFYIYFKSENVTDVDCHGGASGNAIVTVLESTGTLTYTWTDSTGTDLGVNDSTITGLSAGWYYVTVEDSNEGTLQDSVLIEQPNPIELTFTSSTTDTLTCYGDGNGIIDLEASGGTSPFSYTWSNSSTNQDLTGLSSGDYQVTVTDDNGCTKDTAWTIYDPAPLEVSDTSITAPSCYGEEDGSLEVVSVTSGNGGPFSFDWNDPANQTSALATGLDDGSYTVLITDSEGCEKQETYVVPAQDSLSISGTTFDVNCFNGSDGAIQVSVNGGTSPYNYFWSTTDGSGLDDNAGDQTGLSAGTYTLQVIDDNGCEKVRNYVITQPASAVSITDEFSSSIETCYGDSTGSIQITAEGGTGALNYELVQNETSITENNGGDFTGLGAGNYSVYVIDENNCSDTSKEFELTQPQEIVLTEETITNVECYGDSTGSIQVTAKGGTGALTYELNQGENLLEQNSTGDFSELGAASYKLFVVDENSCVDSTMYDIIQPSDIVISNAESSDVSTCYGDSTGSIDVTAEGGAGSLTFELLLDGEIYSENTSGSFSDLPIGDYQVFLVDTNNCTDTTAEFAINQPAELEITNVDYTNVTETGAEDGSITVEASGGTSPLYYTLNPEAIETNQTGEFVSLPQGEYYVEVTDDNDCGPLTTDNITITEKSTGILDLERKYDFSMYPNPMQDEIQVSLFVDERVDIKLEFVNSLGQTVARRVAKGVRYDWRQSINLSSLDSGLYFVKVYFDNVYKGEVNLIKK